jgi:two-component system chemotaxis response regulator CheB
MSNIRVLIADDSAFMRRTINDIISSQCDMEVAGYAWDGEDAVSKALSLKPDVITMDIEMPKINGLEATKEILRRYNCKIIMISSHTSSVSEITIEALNSGAYDFIQKPIINQNINMETIGRQLIDIIHSGFQKDSNLSQGSQQAYYTSSYKSSFCPSDLRPMCLLLGASTGGPSVLYNIITNLPKTIKVPVFVVQHMPPLFTKAFADRINKSAALEVCEASDGQKPTGGTVYIAPGGYHMVLESGLIRLVESPTVHGVRPAVDNLFISASKYYKAPMVACIFTGMGKDGAEGVKNIKKYGGYVMAQDQATSTVFGMPKAAIDTGCVDGVFSDLQIGEELNHIFSRIK